MSEGLDPGRLIFCSGLWLSRSQLAMKVGALWCGAGHGHLAPMTRGKFELPSA